MAIKPDHMAAFVANGEQGGPKPRRDEINPGGKKGKPHNGAKLPMDEEDDGTGEDDEDEDLEDEDDEDEDEEDDEDDDLEEHGTGKFGELISLLEEFEPEIVEVCDNLPSEALDDPQHVLDPEDAEIMADDLKSMPKRLVQEIRKCAQKGVSWDEAQKLAEHLEEEGICDEPEMVAGWIFRAAQTLE